MEDKDLPEIGFKEKKERKGFLPWLRARFGAGSRGSMGSVGANPAAGTGAGLNAGRALGAAKFGAGAKFGAAGGLLSAKVLGVVAIAAVGIGGGLYMSNQGSIGSQSSAFSSDKAQSSDYVPAILRRQASPGSSLDMFADKNKGVIGFDENAAAAKAAAEGDAEAAASEEAAPDAEEASDNSNMADPQAALAKLQGASATGLSTSLSGGGSGKMMMGGFKTGQGAFGPKVGFTDMGAGKFAPMRSPTKGKLTAMAAAKQAVRGSKSASAAKKAKGAFNQANAVRDVQKSYGATNIDSMRSTQDQAWEGTTGEGDVSGGAGLGTGDGGAGIVTSPSLDNASSGGGSGDYDTPGEYNYEDPGATDISPWNDAASSAMTNLLLAAVLAVAGGYLISAGKKLINNPYTMVAGWALIIAGVGMCLTALYLAVDAMIKGFEIMNEHGQGIMGMIYVLGGIAGMANAILCMVNGFSEKPVVDKTTVLWLAAITGLVGMLGGMMNGF